MDLIVLEPKPNTFRYWNQSGAKKFRCLVLEPEIWVQAPQPHARYNHDVTAESSPIDVIIT